MNFINKLERKYGRFAIHNLTLYIIICYVIGYTLDAFGGSILTYLTLEPALILQGQVWRLITWVLIPPSSLDIFTIIMLFFYYSLGTTLERSWGAFRYMLYIFSGLLFTILGAFILYIVTGSQYVGFGGYFTTYYITMSIFLAFAASYPDMRVMLYMIIPIKIKWIAYLDIAMLSYNIVAALRMGNWPIVLVIIASLMNFILFFLGTRNVARYNPKEVKRRQEFKKAVTPNRAAAVTKHKCAVCGRTEEDGDDLEFRFCSKCNGNYEYCQDHLFTHQHVQ